MKFPRLNAYLWTSLACSVGAAVLVLQSSCVTVNVNIPDGAVQKATDDYVKELYRQKEKGKTPAPVETGAPSSERTSVDLVITRVAAFVRLDSPAYADDSFLVQSPKSQEIQGQLASILNDVLEQKRNGNVGETNTGLLKIKNAQIPSLLLKKVEHLVDTENSYRKQLYDEVVRINDNHVDISTVDTSFARSFQAESPSGTWVQASGGSWRQKP